MEIFGATSFADRLITAQTFFHLLESGLGSDYFFPLSAFKAIEVINEGAGTEDVDIFTGQTTGSGSNVTPVRIKLTGAEAREFLDYLLKCTKFSITGLAVDT